VLAFHGQHAFALGHRNRVGRTFPPPSPVLDFLDLSSGALAFSAGGDGGCQKEGDGARRMTAHFPI
jgi:hypothetical protein